MNARFDLTMDKPTFLRWVQEQDRRYDWVKGRAIMQQMTTRDHGRLAARFIHLFIMGLDAGNWNVMGADLAVDLGDQIRYPDVLVERVGGVGKAHETDRPVVLVEVLSPSSVATDFKIKPPHYMALPSLEAYIVASQDEPQCWVWQRQNGTAERPFATDPALILGRDARIDLAAIGISIPLADIYHGMFEA